jgi:hypothetical protein
MTITIPKPITTISKIPKVPGWFFVAALVAEYAIMNIGGTSQPECTIKVQQVHESTYSAEYQKKKDIKIKLSTECSSAQAYTSLNVNLEEKFAGKKNKVVKHFNSVVARPDPSNPNYVLIENLTIPCNFPGTATYSGRAEGEVHLKNGRVVKVSGSSNKPNSVKCRISAK